MQGFDGQNSCENIQNFTEPKIARKLQNQKQKTY